MNVCNHFHVSMVFLGTLLIFFLRLYIYVIFLVESFLHLYVSLPTYFSPRHIRSVRVYRGAYYNVTVDGGSHDIWIHVKRKGSHVLEV